MNMARGVFFYYIFWPIFYWQFFAVKRFAWKIASEVYVERFWKYDNYYLTFFGRNFSKNNLHRTIFFSQNIWSQTCVEILNFCRFAAWLHVEKVLKLIINFRFFTIRFFAVVFFSYKLFCYATFCKNFFNVRLFTSVRFATKLFCASFWEQIFLGNFVVYMCYRQKLLRHS